MALALDAENQRLKAELHWLPAQAPAYVTARVVADDGGIYARAVLLSVGPNHFIRKGQIALDERGLVGRVTDVGARSARVLLITDMNSRIPVVLEGAGAQAIMVGTNGPLPTIDVLVGRCAEGRRTGGHQCRSERAPSQSAGRHGALFRRHVPEVIPAALLDQLEVVRIFDYGLTGMAPPEAGRPPFQSG